MGRKSARFIAQELIGYSASDVYELWKDMGLIDKDKFGDWALTNIGRDIGGRMSKSGCLPVPTFDVDKVINMMINFCEKTLK